MLTHFEQRLLPDDFLVFASAPWSAACRLRGKDEEFWRAEGDWMTRIGPAPAAVTADLEATRGRACGMGDGPNPGVPQQAGLGGQRRPLLPLIQMRRQHPELQGKLVANLVRYDRGGGSGWATWS
jgi:hypothetical protein